MPQVPKVMRKTAGLAIVALLCGSHLRVAAQAQSQLAVSTPERKIHLTFTLHGETKRELEQSLDECKSVEVRYIAELRKQRMLWPDLSFARTTIRNRAACDASSRSRTLQRMVDGSIVASTSTVNQATVLAFMSETGDVAAFQDVTFPSYSYSVRVKSVLVAAPERTRETDVLAHARFEIR